MNLAKANPRTIATLILNGNRELGEVPTSQRSVVTTYIEELKRERSEKFSKPLKAMSVKELRETAKQFPSIKNVSKLTKPWLIEEITEAQKG